MLQTAVEYLRSGRKEHEVFLSAKGRSMETKIIKRLCK